MKFILWIFAVAYVCVALTLCDHNGPCKDHLNKDNTIELHNKVGEVLKVIDDCSQLKDAYAHICLESLGQIKCCKTCKKVDTTCLDSSSARFLSSGSDKQQTCEEFIAKDACNCKKVFKYPGRSSLVVKKTCCASCKNKDLTDCNCRDTFDFSSPLVLPNDKSISSCADLANNFPQLCAKYGKQKAGCCKSCTGVSTKCLDTVLKAWFIDGEMLQCPQLFAKDKCYCKVLDVSKSCCQSCSGVKDFDDCCINDPTYRTNVSVKRYARCQMCSCVDFMERGPDFLRKACRKTKVKRACCQACEGY